MQRESLPAAAMSCSVDTLVGLTVSATTLHRHKAGTATEPILPKDETKLTTLFAAESACIVPAAPQSLHA
jgi:hypothetical protein